MFQNAGVAGSFSSGMAVGADVGEDPPRVCPLPENELVEPDECLRTAFSRALYTLNETV